MSILNELYEKALTMEAAERAELAQRLLRSLDVEEREPGWEEDWREEIERRIDRIERGEAQLHDAKEVMARLRKSLERESSP
jgi:hypothetical protein